MKNSKSLRCAIIGDIIGSCREGSRVRGDYPDTTITGYVFRTPRANETNLKPAELPLCVRKSRPTDDTVLSLAIAEYLSGNQELIPSLKEWYKLYPKAGFGKGFKKWAESSSTTSGASWGNGAAMRISPIVDLCSNVEDVLKLTQQCSIPTHNESTAIQGAQAIALAGFLIKTGTPRENLIKALEKHVPAYTRNLHKTLDQVRPKLRFSVKATDTVPIAIMVFLEAENLEDLYRKALSMGNDADTIAAMAGTIGAYYFDMPNHISEILDSHLDPHMKASLSRFEQYLEGNTTH